MEWINFKEELPKTDQGDNDCLNIDVGYDGKFIHKNLIYNLKTGCFYNDWDILFLNRLNITHFIQHIDKPY